MEPYGSSTLGVLLWNFDARAGLSPMDIVDHPEEFVTSIHVVFGKASVIVEERIARKICENYHFDEGKISGLAHALKLAVSATTRT